MKYVKIDMRFIQIVSFLFLFGFTLSAQNQSISGNVASDEGPLSFATIVLDSSRMVQSDIEGNFSFDKIEKGIHLLEVTFLGYKKFSQQVELGEEKVDLAIALETDLLLFDEVVVTGTKTFKRQTQTAVIVNVIDSKTLDNVQACNLSEGLKFQPGLRVETDCQTCNYTQLRMNGLAGGYSQILINGRPIFSPLTGLYGLEQIPVNMIDKIEVIRGGGSSLYGSSAIGGTVNILTKIPNQNSFLINSMAQNINGQAMDFMTSGNGTIVSKKQKSGASFFINRRDRQAYDHNDDNFSELPEIRNTSLGFSTFLLPAENQKIEFSISNLNEYRYGGELVDMAAHLVQQSEERRHKVWMASTDYQVNFDKASLIAYGAWQNTLRDHYTGIFPDTDEDIMVHLDNPPYGESLTKTVQGGLQFNYELSNFLTGSNVITAGTEYLVDDTFDEIVAYNYLVDQVTTDLGIFVQSDWEITPSINLLSGVRMDKHNLVDRLILSPRISLLYKFLDFAQLRASYGTGFRAPQAFDTDLHIAFSGGGISRVLLDENLKEETSESFNVSLNYDRPSEDWIAGFTIDGFHTRLNDAFTLDPIGEDEFGELFLKKNDQGATVQGLTAELRANYNRQIQVESGFTFQSSRFDNEVEYIDELPGIREFIRTPSQYGFVNVSFTPSQAWNANLNYVYTGSMFVPHFAGAPNQAIDEMFTSPTFHNLSMRLGYTFKVTKNTRAELYGGAKNLFNSYQTQFDIGKNRDSNFVYGPSQPRSLFLGLKWLM